MKKSIITGLMIAGAFQLSSVAFAHDINSNHHSATPQKRLLPVNASAEMLSSPDQATISAGVITQGKNATETATENAAKMTAIFEALSRASIPKSQVKTSQFSLTPKYDYENRKKPRILGYTANNTIAVTTHDLDKVSPIVDALIASGSNNILGVQFSLKDPEAAKNKVLEEAIKKAKAKAQLIARSAGVTLGPLQSIQVDSGGYSPYSKSYDEIVVTGGGGGGGGGVSAPVSQGELTIKATVNLVYEML